MKQSQGIPKEGMILADGTMEGKVWLAGAGPGDSALLTLKAAELIEQADVIVYDALISAEILSRIPEGKEAIYVGKHAGNHPVPQEEINQILVRESRRGKRVLRLKGGDPFVFGRGGEELEALLSEGIPFEVVPGVTSAAAVPAYAGIPVTHRDYASSFHVITGHARKGGQVDLDFPALVRLKGTLVFLMGLSSMAFLLDGLMKAGMDPDLPAAVLENGTAAGQRRVTATVGTLKECSDRAGIQTPAIIVVGRVCALAEQMHWAEDRVLGGRQFLVTRPRKRSSSLAGRLRALGAQVIEMPAIRTEAVRPNGRLKEALEKTRGRKGQEWLVFTSPAGVDVFFQELMEMEMDLRTLFSGGADVRIAAIGSGTALALKDRGLIPDLVPQVYSAKALGEALAKTVQAGSHITAVRARNGSEELLPPLLEAGMDVEDIPLYETRYETHPFLQERIGEMISRGEIDAVTFTSASTVKGFAQTVKEADRAKVRAVCIGEQTASEAAKYGMEIHVSEKASMDSMIEKIRELFGKDSRQGRN